MYVQFKKGPKIVSNVFLRLVQMDSEWVPNEANSSLYIRPTLIGLDSNVGLRSAAEAELFVILCPAGPYYGAEIKPINLLADPKYTRAWPGGCGFVKMGSNYAPTLAIADHAAKYDCEQVLWLFGEDHEVTEAGAMNVFVLWENAATGRTELITPHLGSGMILPGTTSRKCSRSNLTRKTAFRCDTEKHSRSDIRVGGV